MVSTIDFSHGGFALITCHHCGETLQVPMDIFRFVSEHGALLKEGPGFKCACGYTHYPSYPFVTQSRYEGGTQIIGCPKCGSTMGEGRKEAFKIRNVPRRHRRNAGYNILEIFDLVFTCPKCEYSFEIHEIPEREFECDYPVYKKFSLSNWLRYFFSKNN